MSLDSSRIPHDVAALSPMLRDVAARLHACPELRWEEHRAAAWLAEAATTPGATVERGFAGLPTSFRARLGDGAGPRVVIVAEYDALAEIGHACGHNLIAAGALGAFLALAAQEGAIHGTVDLLGTPAEEGGGGKIRLLEAGAFAGADAAMMFHPFDRDLLAHTTLAITWVTMTFRGKPAHAGIAPWDGANALTACMDTFRLVDSQRPSFRDGVRVHGFITNGGQAVNVVPELAVCEFAVRARDSEELARVRAIVERCASGAALASGVEVDCAWTAGYRDMVNNMPLARRFGAHLEALGRRPKERDDTAGAGSTDMGDVSHVVPSIHPWLAICAEGETSCHQREFAVCAAGEQGYAAMEAAAIAMAQTAADVLSDADLRKAARLAFAARA
jgi:amidohydrolase